MGSVPHKERGQMLSAICVFNTLDRLMIMLQFGSFNVAACVRSSGMIDRSGKTKLMAIISADNVARGHVV